jgi:deoxyribodipyrimidine photo-lyase
MSDGPAVLWFRRDLRLADNPALLAAIEDGGRAGVLPLFVLDDRLLAPAGANRVAFLVANLEALSASMGGALVVRSGDPAQVVPAVAAEVGAGSVHVAADFGPYGRARDEAVEEALGAAGVAFVRTGSPYVVDPGQVRKGDGTPFKVFSPFFKAWSAVRTDPPSPAPGAREVRWVTDVESGTLPTIAPTASALPEAGERAAWARWKTFAERISSYGEQRNLPAVDATSRLSPYLKYGVVHPRQLLDGLGRGKGAQRFRFEIAWREFYADVLWHQPDSARVELQPAMRTMAYDEGPEADARFAAWAEGRTGYPIVDAGMRQLVAEGWMHNRVRMITASFLVKDLHLDWRRGARFFDRHLVDGDLASNRHGWQWVAGTGTDPAPYYRVFSPARQEETFDPDGEYIRRYVAEIGTDDYPAPIVDHAEERKEALARYAAANGSSPVP